MIVQTFESQTDDLNCSKHEMPNLLQLLHWWVYRRSPRALHLGSHWLTNLVTPRSPFSPSCVPYTCRLSSIAPIAPTDGMTLLENWKMTFLPRIMDSSKFSNRHKKLQTSYFCQNNFVRKSWVWGQSGRSSTRWAESSRRKVHKDCWGNKSRNIYALWPGLDTLQSDLRNRLKVSSTLVTHSEFATNNHHID